MSYSHTARQALPAALISGSIASVVTTALLAALAGAEGKSPLAPTNATSHWLHGDRDARTGRLDVRHTLIGYLTHHLSSIFWALPFQAWITGKGDRGAGPLLRDAAVMSVIAAVVDYGLTPKRFTPGWENVLSVRSIVGVYGAMALGLAAGAMVAEEIRRRGH